MRPSGRTGRSLGTASGAGSTAGPAMSPLRLDRSGTAPRQTAAPRRPMTARYTATTITAPITATTMLVMLMPVTSATPRTVPARNPPTIAPMIPRMIVPITPSPPPMIRFVIHPAIAPTTIHAMMPIWYLLDAFDGGLPGPFGRVRSDGNRARDRGGVHSRYELRSL